MQVKNAKGCYNSDMYWSVKPSNLGALINAQSVLSAIKDTLFKGGVN